jgi:glutaryl-CoA dehydrogenase
MTTATDLSVNSDFYVLDDYLNNTDRALIARVRSFV